MQESDGAGLEGLVGSDDEDDAFVDDDEDEDGDVRTNPSYMLCCWT